MIQYVFRLETVYLDLNLLSTGGAEQTDHNRVHDKVRASQDLGNQSTADIHERSHHGGAQGPD